MVFVARIHRSLNPCFPSSRLSASQNRLRHFLPILFFAPSHSFLILPFFFAVFLILLLCNGAILQMSRYFLCDDENLIYEAVSFTVKILFIPFAIVSTVIIIIIIPYIYSYIIYNIIILLCVDFGCFVLCFTNVLWQIVGIFLLVDFVGMVKWKTENTWREGAGNCTINMAVNDEK